MSFVSDDFTPAQLAEADQHVAEMARLVDKLAGQAAERGWSVNPRDIDRVMMMVLEDTPNLWELALMYATAVLTLAGTKQADRD